MNEFLTIKELAHVLGKSESSIRAQVQRKKLPAKKIGGKWYFAREWLCTPDINPKENAPERMGAL